MHCIIRSVDVVDTFLYKYSQWRHQELRQRAWLLFSHSRLSCPSIVPLILGLFYDLYNQSNNGFINADSIITLVGLIQMFT